MADLGVAAAACTEKAASLRTRRLQAEDSKLVKEIEASYVQHIKPFKLAKWRKDVPPGFNPVPIVYCAEGEDALELKIQANRVLLGVFRGLQKMQRSSESWIANAGHFTKEELQKFESEDWQDLLEFVLDLHLSDEKVAHGLSLQGVAQDSLRDFVETEQFRLLPFLAKLLYASGQPVVRPVHGTTMEADTEPLGDSRTEEGLKTSGKAGSSVEDVGQVSGDADATGSSKASQMEARPPTHVQGLPKESDRGTPSDGVAVDTDEATQEAFGGDAALPQDTDDGQRRRVTPLEAPPGSSTGQSALLEEARGGPTEQPKPQGAPSGTATEQSSPLQDMAGGDTGQPTFQACPSGTATGQFSPPQDMAGGGTGQPTFQGCPSGTATGQFSPPQDMAGSGTGQPTFQGGPSGTATGQFSPPQDMAGGGTGQPTFQGGPSGIATGQSASPPDAHGGRMRQPTPPAEQPFQGPPLHEPHGSDETVSPMTFNTMMHPGWTPSHGFPQGWNDSSDQVPTDDGQSTFGASPDNPPTVPGAQAGKPSDGADPLTDEVLTHEDGGTGPAANNVGEKRKGEYGNTTQLCLKCKMPTHIRGACKNCGLSREDAKRMKWEIKSAELEQMYKDVPCRRSAQTDFKFASEKLLGLKMKHQGRLEFVLLGVSADGKGNPNKTPMVFATGPPGDAFLGHAAAVKLWASNAETHFLELKKLAEKKAVEILDKTDIGGVGEDSPGQAAQVGGCVSKEVVKWLEDQHMAQYVAIFGNYHWFKMDDLKEMTADSLSEMGIKGLHKQRLLKALNNLHMS